jgi:hypothetical protein
VDWVTALSAIIKALAELIAALAWPAAIICVAWILRKEIRALLARILSIKWKDLEISLREELKNVREAVVEATIEESRKQLAAPSAKQLDDLLSLAKRSPREAIIESWKPLQEMLVEIAKRNGQSTSGIPHIAHVLFLESRGIISKSIADALTRLGAIRDRISANPDFKPTFDEAEEFVLYSAFVRQDLAKILESPTK